MQLTDQQFYLLLAFVPALISAILVYVVTYTVRNRIIASLRQELQQQQQQITNQNINLHQAETRLAVKNQSLLHLQSQYQELKNQFSDLQLNREKVIQQFHLAQTSIKALQVEQLKERQHTEDKLMQLEHNRELLKKDFELLAQQVLKSTQQEFSKESRVGLDLFLQPFRQQISDFKNKVESIHTQDLKQREALKTELIHLQELNRQMTDEAHQLSSALKDQKKTQGNWGELILENVLDRSGLQLGKDYKREVSYDTDDGKRRPDVVVFLPENKHLIIDAKVSLNAYVRYVNAETEAEKNLALKDHVVAISQRIKELSAKNYFDLPGLNTPEMVFMFIPIESAFVEAVKADESLFQLAIEQQVLVTTPTTLLTSLNIVRQLWRFEDQNKYAAKLADQASKVYNQLRLFLENMELLGAQLDKSRETYDNAMRQFVSGKGNLIKRVEDFQNLGVSVKKEMPRELLEKARLELDLIEFHVDKETD
jgi:DNA recombination protein RmuC